MKKGFLIKTSLIFLSILTGIIIFEMTLRIATPKPQNLAKLEESSLFLHENKPNANFNYGNGEFSVDVHLNNFGFRDTDFTTNKNSQTLRIAVLGDSFEEALQVELEETWQKVMSKKLSQEFGKTVESYNFGVSGYGTDQNWLTLREKVWQFSPDLVILAFSPNDVGDTYKNNLVKLTGGKIEVASQKERTSGNFLGNSLRETYTYHLVIKAASGKDATKSIVEIIHTKILGFKKEERFFLSDAQLSQGPFEVIASQKNPPPEVVESWKVIQALIADMNKQASDRRSSLMVTVNIPGNQVDEKIWQSLVNQYHLDSATAQADAINQVLEQITTQESILFYNPRGDALDWQAKSGKLHFPIDGHYNQNGHRFMGNKIADFIIKAGVFGK